jgi:hypothetical protein
MFVAGRISTYQYVNNSSSFQEGFHNSANNICLDIVWLPSTAQGTYWDPAEKLLMVMLLLAKYCASLQTSTLKGQGDLLMRY